MRFCKSFRLLNSPSQYSFLLIIILFIQFMIDMEKPTQEEAADTFASLKATSRNKSGSDPESDEKASPSDDGRNETMVNLSFFKLPV